MRTKEDKSKFVRDLIGNVSRDILDKVDKMPEDWEGNELRKFISERFGEICFVKMSHGRAKAYRNACLERNL